VFDLLHHDETASVQMSKSEVHSASLCSFVGAVTRVLANSTESRIDSVHYFELKKSLCRHCFYIRGFTFKVPKKDFCKIISRKVVIVRADKPTCLRVLQPNNLAALYDAGHLFVTVRPIRPNREITAV
jgi:hypothetical protein